MLPFNFDHFLVIYYILRATRKKLIKEKNRLLNLFNYIKIKISIIKRSGIEYEFMKRNIKPINESREKGERENRDSIPQGFE